MFSILCAASLLLTSLPAEYVYAEETGKEDTGETAEPDLDSMEEEITLPDQSDKEIVEVKTAEELLEVAAKCELDFWSQDKMIELKEDISLELQNGYLTVSAHRDSSHDDKAEDGKWLRRERYVGSCSRSFYVGEDMKDSDIHASYKDGTLCLELPKPQAQQQVETKHRIAIEG